VLTHCVPLLGHTHTRTHAGTWCLFAAATYTPVVLARAAQQSRLQSIKSGRPCRARARDALLLVWLCKLPLASWHVLCCAAHRRRLLSEPISSGPAQPTALWCQGVSASHAGGPVLHAFLRDCGLRSILFWGPASFGCCLAIATALHAPQTMGVLQLAARVIVPSFFPFTHAYMRQKAPERKAGEDGKCGVVGALSVCASIRPLCVMWERTRCPTCVCSQGVCVCLCLCGSLLSGKPDMVPCMILCFLVVSQARHTHL
jgi:hypothetical protein